jgi:hypothetical protein
MGHDENRQREVTREVGEKRRRYNDEEEEEYNKEGEDRTLGEDR